MNETDEIDETDEVLTDPDDIRAEIGWAMRWVMDTKRLRQDDVAPAMGVSQAMVSGWVRGKAPIKVEQLIRFEDVCGVKRGTVLKRARLI